MLDLFGTLVDAPTPADRSRAAARLAHAIGCEPAAVEQYLLATWTVRHDGTIATVDALAGHLVGLVGGPVPAVEPVIQALRALGRSRVVPDDSVIETLLALRGSGVRLGVLSDASPDIVAAWPRSLLAGCIDAAVFSCTAGWTKPDHRLYACVSNALGVPATETLYVGDGGGDELRGADRCGMSVVAVRRRGPHDAMAFGDRSWRGPVIDTVELLPTYLAGLS